MDEITRRRLENEKNNKNIRPEQLLEWALADIREGKIKATKAIIVLCETDEQGVVTGVDPYRCGLTRLEEAGLLAMRMHVHCSKWMA